MTDLVAILGTVDAAFAPVRDWGGQLSPNAMIARKDYPELGIPWHGGGGSVNDRKGAELRLSKLAEAGFVTLNRSKGRTAKVKLTATGEVAARMMAGLPLPEASFTAMGEIAKRAKREPELLLDYWINERLIEPSDESGTINGKPVDKPGETRWLVFLEEMMLPSLIAGRVRVGVTCKGRAYYALTPAGWAALDAGCKPDKKPRAKFSEEFKSAYYESFKAAVSRLKDAQVANVGEIGPMPLSCSMGNWPVSRGGMSNGQ